MTNTNARKFEETVKRLLQTPPKPHDGKDSLTKPGQNEKQDGPAGKPDRPANK